MSKLNAVDKMKAAKYTMKIYLLNRPMLVAWTSLMEKLVVYNKLVHAGYCVIAKT